MNVEGKIVDDAKIDEAVKEILSARLNFGARDMEEKLINHGVDTLAAYRAADRTLQKLRRQGKIFFDRGLWYVT